MSVTEGTCRSVSGLSGWGSSQYWVRRPRTGGIEVSRRAEEVRSALRQYCPVCPGVYGMIDIADQLIYVGMSGCLQRRLLSYFTRRPRRDKQHRIAERARRLIWEPSGHVLLASLRELELIRRWFTYPPAVLPYRGDSGSPDVWVLDTGAV